MNHSSHGSDHFFDSSSSPDALQAVARDLLAAVSSCNDEECLYYDMQLISEGTEEEREDEDASTTTSTYSVVKKVPAIRFVLAARSVVFRKMLYGDFSESQQPTIRLPYSIETLSAVVHFCSHNVIPPSLFHNNNNNNRSHDDDAESLMFLIDKIRLFVELYQAADFLQLPRLYDLAQEYVTHQMTRHPSLACIVIEAAVTTATTGLDDDDDSSAVCPLAQTALQIIECRPYVALHPRTIVHLSSSKLQYVLQNHAMGAGEWFLLQMLLWWHRERQRQQQGHHVQQQTAFQNAVTRDICQSCIKLSHIEPAQLLSLLDSPCRDFIPKDFIFDAIAKQALRASQFKVWRLDCRGRNVNDDRVLVEGAGSPDVNGMYYRLSALSFFASSSSNSNNNNTTSKNDLYVKRELAGGQCFVYTLSRRLRVVPSSSSSPPYGGPATAAAAITTTLEGGTTTTTTSTAAIANATNHGGGVEQQLQQQQRRNSCYECRIFRNRFLSHQAVRKLHLMQLEGTVQPTYQPILQILQLEGPCCTTDINGDNDNQYNNNNTRVPIPIRRFHRVRLSDGDYHMPGTLSDNCGLEPRFLTNNNTKNHHQFLVIQVQEYGLYTIYNHHNNNNNYAGGGGDHNNNGESGGHAGIHVIRAKVLASGPLLRFGNPLPLPPLDVGIMDGGSGSSSNDNNNNDDHATFYTAVYDAPPDHHPSAVVRIPKGGWRSEGSGVDPPPECTYIALREHHTNSDVDDGP